MKHKKLILLSVFFLLSIFICFLSSTYQGGKKPESVQETISEGPDRISLYPAEIQSVLMETAPSPSPSPQPDQPETAVDILSGDQAVVSVSDEDTAKMLLDAYIRSFTGFPEDEIYLSSNFQQEITIQSAEGIAPYLNFDAALAMLTENETLIPVITKTILITEREGISENIQQGASPLLYKGERKIIQLKENGRDICSLIKTYTGMSLTDPGTEEVTASSPSRDMIFETGTFLTKNDTNKAGQRTGDPDFNVSYPMKGNIVSYYGMRNNTFHGGIDIENNPNTEILCPGEGIILYCREKGAYGFTVDIDHGNGFISRLTHLKDTDLLLNQRVFEGDIIGKLDGSDFDINDSPHLHYELLFSNIRGNPSLYLN